MFSSSWFLARKDAKYLLQGRETIFWTFLMPVVFFFFIGTITGGFGGSGQSGGKKQPLIMDVAPDAGFLAMHLGERLDEVGFQTIPASNADPESNAPRLSVPPAFTDSVLVGNTQTLVLTRKKSGLGADYDELRIQRAAFTLLGDLISAAEGGNPPTAEGMAILAQAPPNVTIQISKAGRRRDRIPTGFEQAVPGTMVMFTLIVLLTSGAVLLVIERNQGLLRRLAAAPISRNAVIWGKWGGRMILGSIQIGFAMVLGRVLFKVDWGPNVPMLLLVLLAYGSLVALLGIILGNLARTEGQAVGIGVLASNVLAALGGCWWPIEITPDWMQKLALFLPTGWAMDALHKLVNFGAEPASVVPHILVLITATVVGAWVAARTFRFQ